MFPIPKLCHKLHLLTGTKKDPPLQGPRCWVQNPKWQQGIMCKKDNAQKSQVQQKHNYICLKEFNLSMTQTINTGGSSQWREDAIGAWAHPSLLLDQRIKFLLYFIRLSLLLLAQMTLDRRMLVWVSNLEGWVIQSPQSSCLEILNGSEVLSDNPMFAEWFQWDCGRKNNHCWCKCAWTPMVQQEVQEGAFAKEEPRAPKWQRQWIHGYILGIQE